LIRGYQGVLMRKYSLKKFPIFLFFKGNFSGEKQRQKNGKQPGNSHFWSFLK
jgi:hypothetical protein